MPRYDCGRFIPGISTPGAYWRCGGKRCWQRDEQMSDPEERKDLPGLWNFLKAFAV